WATPTRTCPRRTPPRWATSRRATPPPTRATPGTPGTRGTPAPPAPARPTRTPRARTPTSRTTAARSPRPRPSPRPPRKATTRRTAPPAWSTASAPRAAADATLTARDAPVHPPGGFSRSERRGARPSTLRAASRAAKNAGHGRPPSGRPPPQPDTRDTLSGSFRAIPRGAGRGRSPSGRARRLRRAEVAHRLSRALDLLPPATASVGFRP